MIYRSVSCNKQMACGDFNDSTKTNVTRDSMINGGVTDESVSQLVAENSGVQTVNPEQEEMVNEG